jgi:hypothetical protein
VQNRQGRFKLCHRLPYLGDVSIIIDRQNCKLLFGKFVGNTFDYGKLPQTGSSPNTPKVEKHSVSLKLLERHCFPGHRFQLELWRGDTRFQGRSRHFLDKPWRPPCGDRYARQDQNSNHQRVGMLCA